MILVGMYAAAGDMEATQRVFEEIPMVMWRGYQDEIVYWLYFCVSNMDATIFCYMVNVSSVRKF